jgi:hypothetical protein
MLARSSILRNVRSIQRSFASVADNLDLGEWQNLNSMWRFGYVMHWVSDMSFCAGLPAKYGQFIGGEFVEPASGKYFDNLSPIDGQTFIQSARGCAVKFICPSFLTVHSHCFSISARRRGCGPGCEPSVPLELEKCVGCRAFCCSA